MGNGEVLRTTIFISALLVALTLLIGSYQPRKTTIQIQVEIEYGTK